MLQYAILGFLMDKDMTGYDIKQIMLQSTSNFIDASFGSIYPALKKLAESRSIVFEDRVKDGRYQKLYTITDKGKTEFMQWLRQPISFSPYNYEYLTKLFFYKYLSREERISQTDALIGELSMQLEQLNEIDEICKQESDEFEYATLRFGRMEYENMLKWYKELKEGM